MIGLTGIRKRFGSVAALDGVSLELRGGEIHALLGENGAGKTTLMKILFGLLRPDEGEIHVDSRAVTLRRPEDARRLGIGMVHQHFMLIERMSVAQNVLLGDRGAGFWLSPDRMNRIVADAARRLGIDIDPASRVEALSVGQRQRVELLKVLRRPVRALILDEPTAVLTPGEVEPLFATLRRLRDEGCAIVFISHKLGEVMNLCDRITVLRRGRTIATHEIGAVTTAALTEEMVGRHVTSVSGGRDRAAGQAGAPPGVVVMENVVSESADPPPGLSNVNLQIEAGEIVGVAGVDGNGQAALVETVLGLRRAAAGVIRRPDGNIGHIADDRQREALVLSLSLAENAVLKSHARPPFAQHGILRWPQVARFARDMIARYSVRAASEWVLVGGLSGGNQQKVVVGRELEGDPRLIVAANPTRGLDIAATDQVRRELLARRDAGAAVLLVSSDLDEILALSNRVVVLYRGRLHPTTCPAGGVEEIAALMAGVGASAAR